MVATAYTAVPLSLGGMRNALHDPDAKAVLARNLAAAFKKRGLSARSVARSLASAGLKISNKTVSEMLNGKGNPQISNLLAVARQARVPLWQLLCPALEISHFDELDIHALLESYLQLSHLGRKRALRNLQAEAALEERERSSRSAVDEFEKST